MMPAKKKSSEKMNIDFGGIPDITAVPPDVTPETVEFLRGLIESFNTSAAGLKEAYLALQDKFDKLNLRLEAANLELKQSLDEQERLSNYLTNILESLTSGVLVVDTQGVITMFNRGAEVITGIPSNDAVNKSYRKVMGTDTPEELTPLWVLANNDGRSQMEKTIVSKNGDTIPVGFSISPLLNNAGEVLGAVEIFMDMSGIKALEDELSRMDKLAALGQMSATMAHKIRNPLGGIVGFAGLLNTRLEHDEKGRYHVSRIIEGVENIDHIITSVLAYNSALNLRPRDVNLAERVEETIDIIKQDLYESDSAQIGFTMSQPADPVVVEADADQLNSAMLNIFRNAIEAIEGGGSIHIKIFHGQSWMSTACPLTAALFVKMREGSRLLKSRRPCSIIAVTDSGTGMNEDTLKNLFVPFFTTKEKGIGLGLASARKVIDAHHGEIWVESILNVGTAVSIILPLKSTIS